MRAPSFRVCNAGCPSRDRAARAVLPAASGQARQSSKLTLSHPGLLCQVLCMAKEGLDWWAVAGVEGCDQFLPVGTGPALQNTHATVPAQNRVVVSVRPDRFRCFKVSERFLE